MLVLIGTVPFKTGLYIGKANLKDKYWNIDNIDFPIIKIDNRELGIKEVGKLSANDGFENIGEFLIWFENKSDNGIFTGKIIHWTAKKY